MTEAYRGGRVNPADELTNAPPRRRYPCQAHDCPMPGTLFPGAVQGEKPEGSGICAWHYGTIATDWPRITRVLLDWACVSFEVNEARRVLTGENAANPRAIADAHATAWERLQPLAPGWDEQLQPGTTESYGNWAKRLEQFLGARVVETLSIRQRRAA